MKHKGLLAAAAAAIDYTAKPNRSLTAIFSNVSQRICRYLLRSHEQLSGRCVLKW